MEDVTTGRGRDLVAGRVQVQADGTTDLHPGESSNAKVIKFIYL